MFGGRVTSVFVVVSFTCVLVLTSCVLVCVPWLIWKYAFVVAFSSFVVSGFGIVTSAGMDWVVKLSSSP